MQGQATYQCARLRPAVATLTRTPPAVTCATCRGTGELGRHHKLVHLGGHHIVTTQTNWCPTCKGVGLVWKETTA